MTIQEWLETRKGKRCLIVAIDIPEDEPIDAQSVAIEVDRMTARWPFVADECTVWTSVLDALTDLKDARRVGHPLGHSASASPRALLYPEQETP